MKTSQKGFAPVVLAVIVGILVVGGYITYRYSAQRAVSNSATETKLSAVPDVVTAPAPIQPAVVTPATQKPADETANWKTYRNEKYGFEFQYPVAWNVVALQASSADYMPLWVNGIYSLPRSFVAIYPTANHQDFSARVDVYNVPLATVLRDNRFIQNQVASPERINGVVWTKRGVTDYLVESNSQTYHISGQSDLVNEIVSTFTFTK